MEPFPLSLVLGFAATTALALVLFQRATQLGRVPLMLLLGWTVLQGALGYVGFYLDTSGIPPRFILLIGPMLLLIAALFLTSGGKRFIDGLDVGGLTLLHVVRLPVELVLFGLYLRGAVPRMITFEGSNFDILVGLSAPLIYVFGYVRPKLGDRWLLAWNLICLASLANVVVRAVLAVPTPFQRFAFDQPNVGVLYFPFVWLPSVVVPLVLFAHLVSIRRLLR